MPANSADLKTIANNALMNLGQIKSNAQTKKQLLAEMLANFTTDTEKQATQSQKTTRENASARGILQGSQSFDDASSIENAKTLAIGRAQRQKDIDEFGLDQDVMNAEGGYNTAYADWLAQKQIEEDMAAEAARAAAQKAEADAAAAATNPIADVGQPPELPPMGVTPVDPGTYGGFNPVVAPAPTPPPVAPLAQHQSFMEWHASLSPEDQARFNAAYAAKAAQQPITKAQQTGAQAALAKASQPKIYNPYPNNKKYM